MTARQMVPAPVDRARLIPENIGEFIGYDPDTGAFTRLQSRKRSFVGTSAAYSRSVAGNYLSVFFEGARYPAHRVAWFLHHGEQPLALVDHINGDAQDNRIANLRLASAHENSQNRKAPKKSSSLPKGVSLHSGGRHQAAIRVRGKLTHLGTFDTAEQASKAYQAAVVTHHRHFGRVN